MARARANDEIFVYMGGNQQVPPVVGRARIHKSVKIVRARAFQFCQHLIYVEFHDGIEIIEERAFTACWSLKGPIKLLGVKIIKQFAFDWCHRLTDVEFGDKLETIEHHAFNGCTALKKVRMPSVRTIGKWAFAGSKELSDVEFGGELDALQEGTFRNCPELKRIALPLKGNMIEDGVFDDCPKLETVNLVGGIHQTVASLHLESWRDEMNNEINRINQVLPSTCSVGGDKGGEMRQWMESVIHHLDHYKAEHKALLKEATTLLELALWKTNLAEKEGGEVAKEGQREREEVRVISGASIVIKNVLPFLVLKL